MSNNPLSYTDPSGYFLKKALKIGLTISVSYYTGAWAANYFHGAVAAGIGGAVGGYLNTGSMQGAALGAVSGGVAYGVGGAFKHNIGYDRFGQMATKAVAHGVTQGLIARAGGGRFGDGALGAMASTFGAPAVAKAGPGIRQAMTAAALGGTVSVIGGGKFANGAIAAAWVNLFNDQGPRRNLDHSICSDKGFSCESLPVYERHDVLASATVIIGEIPSRDTLLGPLAKRFDALAWAREQPQIIEARVDLAAIELVHKVVVTYQGRYFGSFKATFLTGRYEEVLRGAPYTRPATMSETMAPPGYPVRVNWTPLVGHTVNESSIQRRW